MLKKNGTQGFGSISFKKSFKMNETNCISKFEHWDYLCQKMKQKYWYLMFEITNYKNGPNLAFSESV